jgi:hypothetical protein
MQRDSQSPPLEHLMLVRDWVPYAARRLKVPATMLDPFFRNHLINPRTFSVGGRLSPIAIRDQIIRGYMIVERAFEQDLIHKEDNLPLLIVGAGVSGITAAIRAAEIGVWTMGA